MVSFFEEKNCPLIGPGKSSKSGFKICRRTASSKNRGPKGQVRATCTYRFLVSTIANHESHISARQSAFFALDSQLPKLFLKALAVQTNCRRGFGDVPIVLAELSFDECNFKLSPRLAII